MIWRRAMDVFAKAHKELTGRYGAVWRKINVLDKRSTREVGTWSRTTGPMMLRRETKRQKLLEIRQVLTKALLERAGSPDGGHVSQMWRCRYDVE
jgi:hypothetical protein